MSLSNYAHTSDSYATVVRAKAVKDTNLRKSCVRTYNYNARLSHDDVAQSFRFASNRATVDHWILDLALVVAPVDLEKALVPPVFIPAVRAQPIRSAILSTSA